MKKFIAYFDFLGFKSFIENNDIKIVSGIMENIFLDIETALSERKIIKQDFKIQSDMSDCKIQCINFSDTVIFWTIDNAIESLNELLLVSHIFNYRLNDSLFPVRGSIIYGDIEYVERSINNSVGGKFNINSAYGLGIIKAYEKAESQNWAGTVVDSTVIDELENRKLDYNEILTQYAKLYKVPYKKKINNVECEEYVYKWLVNDKINNVAFKNIKAGIESNFSSYNKSINASKVEKKLKNTIKFIKSFK